MQSAKGARVHIPIILYTDANTDSSKESLLAAGYDDYARRSSGSAQFIDTIKKYLKR